MDGDEIPMKYELKRDFYYHVYKSSTPRCYMTKIDTFDNLVELRDYIRKEYHEGYIIQEVGLNFIISNAVCQIMCFVRGIQ